MKKVLIVLCALILGLNASAQEAVQFIAETAQGKISLHHGKQFFLVANGFGDDFEMFLLGESQAAAVAEMDKLVKYTENGKEMKRLTNFDRDGYIMNIDDVLCISFFNGQSGYIEHKQLKVLQKALKEWKNEN